MLLAGFIRKQRESRQVYDRNPYKKNHSTFLLFWEYNEP